MCQWHRNIQRMIDEIDACIRREDDEAVTLHRLAAMLGYSESYVSRKFRSISGMRLREYLLGRRLAFALRDLRDGGEGILHIALKYATLPARRLPMRSRRPMAFPPANTVSIPRRLRFAPCYGRWTATCWTRKRRARRRWAAR